MKSAPPGTFVPADDNLFPPVVHAVWWIGLGVIAFVAAIGVIVWCFRAPRSAAFSAPTSATVPEIKAHYLTTIDHLRHEFDEHLLDERQLHHRLSWTVRRFAADLADPGAVAMTPSALDDAGLTAVADVVAGYQEPQFSESAESDPAVSVASAKAVIESW